jgi:antirestriction protein ArdC
MKITKQNKIEAGSTAYRGHILPRETPQAMIQRMETLIRASGYTLRIKGPRAFKASMTTTDPVTRTVWLTHGWADRPDARKATTLAHEYVHILQHRAYVDAKRDERTGLAAYARKYASCRGRWIIEMQAYAVSILAARSIGSDTSAMPKNIAETMWKNYKPWMLFSKGEIIDSTIEFLEGV